MMFPLINRQGSPRRLQRKQRPRVQPRLEALEGRALLSTLMVTNNLDTGVSGDGSLRGEILAASSGDTIDFNLGPGSHQITLTSSELYINKILNIAGPALNNLTIQGDGVDRVFEVAAGTSSNPVTISGLTIAGGNTSNTTNGAGGGIRNTGTLMLTNSTVSGNEAVPVMGPTFGGGIDNEGTATVTNSTVSRNYAAVGGGIFNSGTLTLTNSTVSGNSANGGGGILDAGGAGIATVTNSTISGNSAGTGCGGIGSANGGTLYLGNTILAGNSGGKPADFAGTLKSLGYNLIGKGDGSTVFAAGDQVGTAASPIDPRLGPLQNNNSGPTWTMALLRGSPAIDAGSNALIPAGVTTDQRGPGFGRIYNGTVDIGAYELQDQTSQASTTTTITSLANTSVYGQAVTFTAIVRSGAGTPTGTVTFNDGSTTLGIGTLSNGVATFTTSALAVGTHGSITAVYGGTSISPPARPPW